MRANELLRSGGTRHTRRLLSLMPFDALWRQTDRQSRTGSEIPHVCVCACDIFGLNHLRVNCIYQFQFFSFTFFRVFFRSPRMRIRKMHGNWKWWLSGVAVVPWSSWVFHFIYYFYIYLLFITNMFPVAVSDREILKQTPSDVLFQFCNFCNGGIFDFALSNLPFESIKVSGRQ